MEDRQEDIQTQFNRILKETIQGEGYRLFPIDMNGVWLGKQYSITSQLANSTMVRMAALQIASQTLVKIREEDDTNKVSRKIEIMPDGTIKSEVTYGKYKYIGIETKFWMDKDDIFCVTVFMRGVSMPGIIEEAFEREMERLKGWDKVVDVPSGMLERLKIEEDAKKNEVRDAIAGVGMDDV